MSHLLAALLAVMQLLVPALSRPGVTDRLRSGEWLRFHVVAHDDSTEMQRLKLCVRDAVQACYAAHRPQDTPMLAAAGSLLPLMTRSAEAAARREGFTGEVAVTLGILPFDERSLSGMTIPAGDYPALVIRLGDAQGHNWWGVLDPETSLSFAAIGETQDGALRWDWSWEALLAALFGRPVAGDA